MENPMLVSMALMNRIFRVIVKMISILSIILKIGRYLQPVLISTIKVKQGN